MVGHAIIALADCAYTPGPSCGLLWRAELRGSVKDEVVDESDTEWDDEIELRFGRRAFEGHPEPPPPMDAQFRPARIVEDIMTAAEALHAEAMVSFECEGEGGDSVDEEVELLYQQTTSSVGVEDDRYMTCGEEEEDGEGGSNEECTDPLLSPVLEASKVPLFAGSLVSLLSAIIIIMNCSRVHGVPSAFVNELLHVLSHVILPQPNSLPSSEAATSSMLKKTRPRV